MLYGFCFFTSQCFDLHGIYPAVQWELQHQLSVCFFLCLGVLSGGVIVCYLSERGCEGLWGSEAVTFEGQGQK